MVEHTSTGRESIEATLRERIARALGIGATSTRELESAFARIMAVVDVALVLKAREAVRAYGGKGNGYAEQWIRDAHPLPVRTRQVLREEPVPGMKLPEYRWAGGRLQVRKSEACDWVTALVHASDATLMRHALDLHDSPFRTVEEPADESNPWPEVG